MAAAQEIGTPVGLGTERGHEARALVRIPIDDAKRLRWYFGENMIAGIAIASDMGIMLERAALMALRISPCRTCGGDPKTDQPGTGNAPRKGSYKAALDKWHREQARQAKAIYCATRAEAERLELVAGGFLEPGEKRAKIVCGEDLGNELPERVTRQCPRCQGTGMRERRANNRGGAVTARPTGSSQTGNPDAMHAIDEAALELWSRTSRDLEDVCTESALARVALQMYYSPGGGSAASLWRLTEAGDRFLEREPNPHKIRPDQLLENARSAQATEPTRSRTEMFSAIARESAEVWDLACATWVRVTSEVSA